MGFFDFVKRKDLICGMIEEKGKGLIEHNKWFCSKECLKQYEQNSKNDQNKSCCG